ncbi:MAG: hypothetical protein GF347_01440 [Candidatus Moranbacteria bacterium]|nr:hypothetical protein [Candidatus Moranbacteria bacterium]
MKKISLLNWKIKYETLVIGLLSVALFVSLTALTYYINERREGITLPQYSTEILKKNQKLINYENEIRLLKAQINDLNTEINSYKLALKNKELNKDSQTTTLIANSSGSTNPNNHLEKIDEIIGQDEVSQSTLGPIKTVLNHFDQSEEDQPVCQGKNINYSDISTLTLMKLSQKEAQVAVLLEDDSFEFAVNLVKKEGIWRVDSTNCEVLSEI